MNHLTQHIVSLLAEHECVIVPGLGGFISRPVPSRWVEEDCTFLPPRRVLAFNPRLTMNDGLLVQVYMRERNLSYADALAQMDREVQRFVARLHADGSVILPKVGVLHCALDGTFRFTSYDDELVLPEYYGLQDLVMHPLKNTVPQVPIQKRRTHRRALTSARKVGMWQLAALLVLVVWCFLAPVPIRNTSVEPTNRAHLFSPELFDCYVSRSIAMTPVAVGESNARASETPAFGAREKQDIASDSVSENSSILLVKALPTESATRRYHVIVASMATEQAAQEMARELRQKGYENARAIIGDGRMRVSAASWPTEAEAYRYVEQLKTMGAFNDAWVLTR